MSCLHCGDCCRYVALEVPRDLVPFLDLHDVKLVDQFGHFKVIIDQPCRWHDDKAQRCRNYEERPLLCQAYLCTKARVK